MAALDTNVLVRFLVGDDQVQSAAARKLIEQCIRSGEGLFVPVTVVLELEWVLRSNYRFDKVAVLSALSGLLATTELRLESESALEWALTQYSSGKADFSDCVHAALAVFAGEEPLWTFDKAAAKVDGAHLLA